MTFYRSTLDCGVVRVGAADTAHRWAFTIKRQVDSALEAFLTASPSPELLAEPAARPNPHHPLSSILRFDPALSIEALDQILCRELERQGLRADLSCERGPVGLWEATDGYWFRKNKAGVARAAIQKNADSTYTALASVFISAHAPSWEVTFRGQNALEQAKQTTDYVLTCFGWPSADLSELEEAQKASDSWRAYVRGLTTKL